MNLFLLVYSPFPRDDGLRRTTFFRALLVHSASSFVVVALELETCRVSHFTVATIKHCLSLVEFLINFRIPVADQFFKSFFLTEVEQILDKMGRQNRGKFTNGNSYNSEPLPERGPGM